MKNIEIATIYCSAGLPYNKSCKQYFQISEQTMVHSWFGPRAGKILLYNDFPAYNYSNTVFNVPSVYSFFKSIASEPIRLLRDIIWTAGRIDVTLLKKFIRDFDPDIVFSQRMGSIKMCRIERLVKAFTNVPMVAYSGDDEYSLKQFSFSPIYWLRRLWLRHELNRNIPFYSLFFSMSKEQMNEYNKKFGVRTKFLVKCGVFDKSKIHSKVSNPIVITYVGKLYCNRWKTLALLSECIKEVNACGMNFMLYIYTKDKITKKQFRSLDNGVSSVIKGSIEPECLPNVFAQSDIVLHVESLDLKNSLLTKYSFSTKIMDYMASGCAVMAIGKKFQAGCSYLREHDIAFVASDEATIKSCLNKIGKNPDLILEYARKCYMIGVSKHDRSYIQNCIYNDFADIIENKR